MLDSIDKDLLSFAQINLWSHFIDDLMAVQGSTIFVQIPHLQAEKVLLGDHGGDLLTAEVVQGQRLNVALGIACPVDYNEAAN